MEGEHHDVVCCALAKTLRDGMRSCWSLPSEAAFAACDREWLFNLLGGVNSEIRVSITATL
jgi:hypothetical protein